MNAKIKVSVIIPVYNAADFLRKCVDSVRHQTLTDIEILLIDDGSTDSSGLLCDALAGEDKRIRVLHKQNEGAGLSRNAGLSLAKGE